MPLQTKTIAIIRGPKPSAWKSSQWVTSNFCESYSQLLVKTKIFFSAEDNQPAENARLAFEIKEFKPTHLIFVDYDPHPLALLEQLNQLWTQKQWPEIIFHIFGDFTLKVHIWNQLEGLLLNKKIIFLAASPKQRNVLSQFIDPQSVKICEYRIDRKQFQVSKIRRQTWRKKIELAPDDVLLTYSGRLSLQKNVHLLLEVLTPILQNNQRRIHLAIAGPYDSMVSQAFGFSKLRGDYYKELRKFIFNNKQVTYLGNLHPEDLAGLYNATDLIVSLSTHHEEEFGMAVAEALCCGTQALISDWGGHTAFAGWEGGSEAVSLIPVQSSKVGLSIDTESIRSKVLGFYHKNWNYKQRQQSAKSFQQKLSVRDQSEQLNDLIDTSKKRFKGFTAFHKLHAKKMNNVFRKTPIYGNQFWKDSNYQKIYGHFGSASGKHTNGVNITKRWEKYWLPTNLIFKPYVKNKNMHFMMNEYWPMTQNYTFQQPKAFLGTLQSIKELSQFQNGIMRDGLIPMTWFFHRFPLPKGFIGKVYVAEGLQHYVPIPWRKNIGTYEFRRIKESTPYEKIILCVTHGQALQEDDLLLRISEAKKIAKKLKINLGKTEALILKNSSMQQNSQSASTKLHTTLVKQFNRKLIFIDFNKLHHHVTASQALIICLDDNLICRDHAIVNHMVAIGCSTLGSEQTEPLKSKDLDIPVSLTHSIYLNRTPQFENCQKDFLRAISKYRSDSIQDKDAIALKPWPNWLEDGIRAYTKVVHVTK